jgi:hypothetical protein
VTFGKNIIKKDNLPFLGCFRLGCNLPLQDTKNNAKYNVYFLRKTHSNEKRVNLMKDISNNC